MTDYRKGELLLVAFPFVENGRNKRRPALVVADTGDNDVVVARVTTQHSRDQFDAELVEWQAAGLLAPSIARINKVATINKSLVEKRLGMPLQQVIANFVIRVRVRAVGGDEILSGHLAKFN